LKEKKQYIEETNQAHMELREVQFENLELKALIRYSEVSSRRGVIQQQNLDHSELIMQNPVFDLQE
jgi:hypothetical protein